MPAKAVLMASVVLGAAIAAGGAYAAGELDDAAIKRLVAGRSASWVSAEGRSGVITYHGDGKLSARAKVMGMMMPVSGSWEVKGGKFCRTIRMDSPPTKCQTVVQVSGKTYKFYNANGTLATTTTFD